MRKLTSIVALFHYYHCEPNVVQRAHFREKSRSVGDFGDYGLIVLFCFSRSQRGRDSALVVFDTSSTFTCPRDAVSPSI